MHPTWIGSVGVSIGSEGSVGDSIGPGLEGSVICFCFLKGPGGVGSGGGGAVTQTQSLRPSQEVTVSDTLRQEYTCA